VGIYDRRRAVCLELAGGENPRDVIHCDLHFDNIVISPDGSDVRFCDIDDVCLGARAMDLAMIAFDLGVILRSERPGPAVAGRVDAVLGAYADASGTRYSLADLLPWVELLEVAVFLQCTDFDYSGDDEEDWGVRFMKGRESRLERGIPYFDAL
jgi:Ser/Thr protein kinase RdoA (MazF antagonist)